MQGVRPREREGGRGGRDRARALQVMSFVYLRKSKRSRTELLCSD